MQTSIQGTTDRASLRQRALTKLTVSSSTDPKRAGMSDALVVLHQLASSPSTASDALALLHELQVYQVELEMQQDELQNSRSELETALSRQTALVERAPVGYMAIDAGTVLEEVNLAGAHLLGAPREELVGRPLTSLLSKTSASKLRGLLDRGQDGLGSETFNLQLRTVAGRVRTMHAAVSKDTSTEHFLLVLMAAAPADPMEG